MPKLSFDNTLIPILGKTAKMGSYYITQVFSEHQLDLSKEQWLVLKRLNDTDGQVQNDLAFITGRSKTSLTRLIHTMEKKDLVYRKHSSLDKRINHVFLTEKGKEVFKQSLPLIRQMIIDLQEGIPENDLKRANDVLNKIQHNIQRRLHKQAI